MTPQKAVLQLSIHEGRIRKKAWKAVSGFQGVTSISLDDKTGKMTVTGELDVSIIVMKLRKICNTELVSVEVVKPPEKKPDPPKPAPPKPVADNKDNNNVVAWPVQMANPYQYSAAYSNSYYHQHQPHAYSRVVVDDQNPCVIM